MYLHRPSLPHAAQYYIFFFFAVIRYKSRSFRGFIGAYTDIKRQISQHISLNLNTAYFFRESGANIYAVLFRAPLFFCLVLHSVYCRTVFS